MSREVWATFAINDHCIPRAFVADVMLYDRLVIPVPPDNPTEDDKALWALTLDKAFLSIGQFVAERTLEAKEGGAREGAALFSDFQRHFGWNPQPKEQKRARS